MDSICVDKISLETLRPSHLEELTDLMYNAFGNRVSSDYFQWKYIKNPLGPAVGNIARDNSSGTIIAFYGLIPQLYRFDGKERLLYQSCDTMTHSKFRRQGLFQRLAERTFQEQLSLNEEFFAIGFSGSNSTPGFLKMGWKKVFELSPLLRPRFFSRLAPREGQLQVSESSSISPEVERAFEARHRTLQSGIVIDKDYLRWKWSNPRKAYSFLTAGSSICVYHLKGDLIYIDYVLGEERDGLREIGRKIDALARRLPVRGVTSMAQPGRSMERALRSWGFFSNPFSRGPGSQRLPFITFAKAGRERHLLTSAAWDLSPVDHDNF